MATVTTEQVRTIWEQELSMAGIGDDDDFFEIGGHSLIMAKIQERVAAELDVVIPMDTLFRRPTVVQTAAYVDEQSALSSS